MTTVTVTESPTVVTVNETTLEVSIATTGIQGATGATGATGAQGPAGVSGGQYTHTQNSPSATWTIAHNLAFNPNVTVIDSAGTAVEGSYVFTDINNLTITFSASFAGYAYLS